MDGTLSPVSEIKFKNRLQHLANTFEITCLSSSLSDFNSPEWQISREYDRRLISDLEVGLKSWDTLKNCIDPTCWSYAKEVVQNIQPNSKSSSRSPDRGHKLCITWNKF